MQDWQFIVRPLQSWLDQWAAVYSNIPFEIAVAAILLPVGIAMFSRRTGVILSCILLTLIPFCALISPSSIVVTLASGAYLGSLIMALYGIIARRETEALKAEMAALRKDMDRLLVADERRFMDELRNTKGVRGANIMNISTSRDSST